MQLVVAVGHVSQHASSDFNAVGDLWPPPPPRTWARAKMKVISDFGGLCPTHETCI